MAGSPNTWQSLPACLSKAILDCFNNTTSDTPRFPEDVEDIPLPLAGYQQLCIPFCAILSVTRIQELMEWYHRQPRGCLRNTVRRCILRRPENLYLDVIRTVTVPADDYPCKQQLYRYVS